jgi:hypothetical protein
LIVSAEVLAGKEEAFNKWYDEHHIPVYSGKMPLLKSIRRFYSKKSTPQFIAIYEYSSFDDLKKSMASKESQLAGQDADEQIGKLVKSFSYNTYSQIYPR